MSKEEKFNYENRTNEKELQNLLRTSKKRMERRDDEGLKVVRKVKRKKKSFRIKTAGTAQRKGKKERGRYRETGDCTLM